MVQRLRAASAQKSRAEKRSRITQVPPTSIASPGANTPAVGMVHGQAVVDAVARPRARDAREGLHGELHAVVIEVRRLGQPRRARRVDQDAGVIDGQRGALRGTQRRVRQGVEEEVEAGMGAGVAVGQHLDRMVEQRARRVEPRHQARVHDGHGSADEIQRMGQRRAALVRVDQRGGGPGLCRSRPTPTGTRPGSASSTPRCRRGRARGCGPIGRSGRRRALKAR